MSINLRPNDDDAIGRSTDALAEYLREPTQARLAALASMLQDYQDRWIAERVKDQERAQAVGAGAR